MYQEFLKNYMSQEDAQKYTHHKLKIKLQTKSHFIVFHSAPQTNKPNLISHISLKLKNITNKAVDHGQRKKLKEILTAQSLSGDLSRVEPGGVSRISRHATDHNILLILRAIFSSHSTSKGQRVTLSVHVLKSMAGWLSV